MQTRYLGLVFLLIGTVAAASDDPVPAPQDGPVAAAAGARAATEGQICVTRTMIGSNMPRKICRSAAQVRKDGKRPGLPVDPSITFDNFEGRAGQN